MRRITVLVLVLSLSLFQAAPARTAQGNSDGRPHSSPLVFILLPVENVAVMYEKFLPLKAFLEKEIQRPIVLKVARNYEEAIESIGTGRAQLAYLDPSAYCEARKRYKVIPLARAVLSGSPTYRSVIVSRKDSAVRRIIDARGRRVALGNIRSSSSALIPSVMFKEVGLSMKDFDSVDYLEQEDRIALSVLAGRHDIGGLSEGVARKYLADGLRIIKTSEAIPQYSLCAFAGLAPDLQERIKAALLSIRQKTHSDLIRNMKDMNGFSAAQDRDFDVVRVMIKNLTGKNYIEYSPNSIKVAILPLYSAITLFDRFDPLMRYLSRKTGYEFKLVIPRDFEDFMATVQKGMVEFTYSNPYIYIQLADKGYLKAFATTVHQESGDIFRGIIITHRDSDIRTLQDLRGKKVMVVSFKSAGGFLAQKLYLREKGIDAYKELRLVDGKRQEEVILNVYRKNVDAGFIRESALGVLQEEIDLSKVRILARTPYIANWPFAATGKADVKTASVVQKSLLELRDSVVLSPAHITAFKAATDADFDSLRKWINRYEIR